MRAGPKSLELEEVHTYINQPMFQPKSISSIALLFSSTTRHIAMQQMLANARNKEVGIYAAVKGDPKRFSILLAGHSIPEKRRASILGAVNSVEPEKMPKFSPHSSFYRNLGAEMGLRGKSPIFTSEMGI